MNGWVGEPAVSPTVYPYDVMPARFLKQVVHIVGSDVLNFVNLSLSTGIVPDSLKCALIMPIKKKPNSDMLIFFLTSDLFQMYLLCPKCWRKLF